MSDKENAGVEKLVIKSKKVSSGNQLDRTPLGEVPNIKRKHEKLGKAQIKSPKQRRGSDPGRLCVPFALASSKKSNQPGVIQEKSPCK